MEEAKAEVRNKVRMFDLFFLLDTAIGGFHSVFKLKSFEGTWKQNMKSNGQREFPTWHFIKAVVQ